MTKRGELDTVRKRLAQRPQSLAETPPAQLDISLRRVILFSCKPVVAVRLLPTFIFLPTPRQDARRKQRRRPVDEGSHLGAEVAIGRHVRWGGVDLAALLAKLEVDPRARFLWSYGLDGGDFAGTSCEWFAKDLPIERLAAGDVLLAYELNGAPLPAEHGFPVRLVVPGFYGTNSVKWLWRLHLADRRADGPFTTVFYNDSLGSDDVAAGLPPRRPVWAIAPESIIVSPAPDTVVAAGEPVEIWGRAWSFRGIAAVEISVDGGARLHPGGPRERRGWAWQRFSLPWRPTERGEVVLSVRALDAGGAGQPQAGARNSIHTVRVAVR